MKQPKATALRLPKNTLGSVNPLPSKDSYQTDFYGNNSRDGVDFPALIRFINKVSTNPKCIFNWRDFEKQPTIQTYDERDRYLGTIKRIRVTNNNIPFTYQNELGQTIKTELQVQLNKRIDYIVYDWGFNIEIDAKKQIILSKLSFYYVNTEKYRKQITETVNPNDFAVSDKYRGIIFKLDNLTHFSYLIKSLDSNQFDFIKNKITTKMVEALKVAKEKEEIVFLFENAPSWIAENFKSKELIAYLKHILSYDVNGWFSGYVDGSCAFINVLRGFNTLEKCVDLYNFFKKNPKFVKDTYHALDSTSVWEGVEQPNKTIFASFLTSLSYAVMGVDGVNVGVPTKTFYLGDGYTVNTSAIGALDFNDTEYFLKQERTTLVGFLTLPNYVLYPITYDEDLEEGSYYDPLQMVQLYDVTQKTVIVVPAIFLHDTASRKELTQIMKAVRIGVNIFTIAISIASLGSASPLIALAAAADVAFATADTIIALAEDELSKEFVDAWGKIYLVGGVVTAGPVLLNGIFKGGVKILDGTAKAEFKNFVRAFIFKVIIDKNIANFTKNSLRIVTESGELASISNGLLNTTKLRQFNESGAILVAGEVKNADKVYTEYALVYNGELVFKGDKATFSRRVKKFFEGQKGKGLKEYFEEFLGGNNYGKSIVETNNPVKVQEFIEGLEKLSKIKIVNSIDYIKDAMPYFNHKAIGDEVIQISKLNCGNTVESVVNFLKTGKIKLAEPSLMQGLEGVATKFGGGSFSDVTIPRLKEILNDGEISIIYGPKKYLPSGKVEGHYFVGMKKNNQLHLFDGQTGEYVIFSQTDRKYADFIQRKYIKFQYLKVK
jgi:hypothetical protein